MSAVSSQGSEGSTHGLARAGFRHAFLCESDPWRRTVLAHHFLGVPIYEDVADIQPTRTGRGSATGDRLASESSSVRGRIEQELHLLCGGFPCQDVSIAGRRAGLAGERSGLFYEFARVAESFRPRFLLVENVPGLLSSNGGRDFGAVLGTLADIGYGLAWRILDSRYFGVPQRRRRVFVLGALADGDPRAAAERAGEILAVGTRCERHPAAGTEARKDVAGTLGGGSGNRGWAQDTERMTFVASTLKSQDGRGWSHDAEATYVAAPLSHGSNPNSNMAGRRREDDENLVPWGLNTNRGGNADMVLTRDASPPITGSHGNPGGVMLGAGVRRLTPTECERLQALPDGWTAHGPDSRRYAALGDAVTSSVAEWIGRRLIRAGAAA
jgi:DNA (cytosine-5)-methyltransferase 1